MEIEQLSLMSTIVTMSKFIHLFLQICQNNVLDSEADGVNNEGQGSTDCSVGWWRGEGE